MNLDLSYLSYYSVGCPKKQIRVSLPVDILEWADKHLINKNRNTFIELACRCFIDKLYNEVKK